MVVSLNVHGTYAVWDFPKQFIKLCLHFLLVDTLNAGNFSLKTFEQMKEI